MAAGRKTGGRVAGTPNKTTAEAIAKIEDAFAHLQNKGNTAARKDLKSWAEDNTDDFYKLIWPKVIPHQVNHRGHDGGKLVIEWQTGSSAS